MNIDNAVSVFFPSRGEYSGDESLSYYLLHFASYLFIAMIAFSIWGRRILNRVIGYLLPGKHRNIIWGYSHTGVLLARDISESITPERAIFILPQLDRYNKQLDDRNFEEIDRINGVVMYGDYEKIKKAPKGYNHFFVTEDQDFNVNVALKILHLLCKKKNDNKIHLYVRTEIERIDDYFTTEITRQKNNIEVHIFNQSDLAAQNHIGEYPMYSCDTTNSLKNGARVYKEFNILFLGFGWMGYEVLKKCMLDCQFVGSTTKITVVDESFHTRNGEYVLWEAIEEYKINFYPTHNGKLINYVGNDLFYKWIDDYYTRNHRYDRIIVALGNDDLNVEIALNLSRILQNKGISSCKNLVFAHVRFDKYTYYQKPESPITIFGNLKEIYRKKSLVSNPINSIAKQMNYSYHKNNKKEKTENLNADEVWQGTSLFSQSSTRASALGIKNTLWLLGYKYIPRDSLNKQQFALSKENWEKLIDEHLEVLAENEHKRWCAFHLMNGVRKWEHTKDGFQEKIKELKGVANQVRLYNSHAAILPYRDLPELDEKINKAIEDYNTLNPGKPLKPHNPYQENDREFIRGIYTFLSEGGMVIVPFDYENKER